MEKKELAEMYRSYLTEEGYRPDIDADGDVTFKKEGLVYIIIIQPGDDKYFRVICPNIWSVENDAERIRVLAACDVANGGIKVAKMFILRNSVWVSAETFLSEPEGFKPIFERILTSVQAIIGSFTNEMSAAKTSATETTAGIPPPAVTAPSTT